MKMVFVILILIFLELVVGTQVVRAQELRPRKAHAHMTAKKHIARQSKRHVRKATALRKSAKPQTHRASVADTDPDRKLRTDFHFDDQLVGGKYQYPDEAVATVEDDKTLNDLLSPRKNFRDRLTAERLESARE